MAPPREGAGPQGLPQVQEPLLEHPEAGSEAAVDARSRPAKFGAVAVSTSYCALRLWQRTNCPTIAAIDASTNGSREKDLKSPYWSTPRWKGGGTLHGRYTRRTIDRPKTGTIRVVLRGATARSQGRLCNVWQRGSGHPVVIEHAFAYTGCAVPGRFSDAASA
jgi:hypothetical protein